MSCFDNLIGVKGLCDDVQPQTSLWINDLPGIDLKTVDAGLNEEAKSAYDEIQKAISFGIEDIINTAAGAINPAFRMHSIIENDVVGKFKDNLELDTVLPGQLKGIEIEICRLYPYLQLEFSTIKLQTNFTGAVDVFVYDLTTGLLIDTIQVETGAQNISISRILKTYAPEKQTLNLFIGYDGAIENYSTNLFTGSGCRSCGNDYYGNQYVTFRGRRIGTGDTKIKENLTSITGTSGISLTYNLRCSYRSFLCSTRDGWAWAALFKAGEWIMKNLKYSKRLNSVINIYEGQHEELAEMYAMESDKKLKQFLIDMRLPNDLCFSCNPRVSTRVNI